MSARHSDGKFYSWGPFENQGGQHCTPAAAGGEGSAPTPGGPPDPAKPDKPLACQVGQCPGKVNGVDVCVKCGEARDNKDSKDTSEKPEPDGGRTTTTNSRNTSTECIGTQCTTTTTTTTTSTTRGPDGSITRGPTTTTGTDSSTEPIADFCKKNPMSPMCKTADASEWGGGCAGGAAAMTCKGDAIQCAIAQDQIRRNCQAFEGVSPERQLYENSKYREGNTTLDNPLNESISAAIAIDQTDVLGGGGSGMKDLTIDVMGKSVLLPFSQVNPYLDMLGRVLVAVSFLLAFRIVSRG